MTDKAQHESEYGESIKLIQDDEIFYTAVLSFGGMGIAYEITIEMKPTFWLKERRYLEKWSVVREKLLSGELSLDRRHFGIGSGEWANVDQVGFEVAVRFHVEFTRRGE